MAYTCTKCGAQFSSRDALRQHQFAHIYDEGPDRDESLQRGGEDVVRNE